MVTKSKRSSQHKSFARGFWRGLAAPLLLYSSSTLPSDVKDYSFKPLPPMKRGSLREDWQRVGATLHNAVNRAMHG